MIGKPLPRVEDLRLVAGKGRYTDDIHPSGAAWMCVVRVPHAHARIKSVSTAAAAACPGVLAVLTAADYRADGHTGMGHLAVPTTAQDAFKPSVVATPDKPVFDQPHWPLAEDRVRYPGEGVAIVVAETREQARDAAELVEVDVEELPAVTSIRTALADGAPQLWPEAKRNTAFRTGFGDEDATKRAFAAAAVVVEHEFHNSRVANAQMEPRSAIGVYEDGITRLISGSQGVSRQKTVLAQALGVQPDKVHVVCPDVGGGFGPRSNLYPEQVLVCWAARRVGRPVRWTSDRSEAFLTDYQGRDMIARAALALSADGRILALRTELLGNIGAHTVTFVPLFNSYRVLTNVYDIPAAYAELCGVLTNTVPTAPYRGAGRPEATHIIERLLDMAARRLKLDRVEIRRRNMIAKSALPYRNPMGLNYDSGDFHANLQTALDRADWSGFTARREASLRRGRRRGIAVANYIEAPVGAPRERVVVTVRRDDVEIISGTQSTGQGHETSFAQVIADYLGVPFERIRLVTGDTSVVSIGGGTHSDRSMRIAGTLLVKAATDLIERGRALTAPLLNAAPADLTFADGRFHAPHSDRSLSLFDLARDHELAAPAEFSGRIPAHPTGCAVCELEVDPETGVVDILRYTTVDDVGQAINPLIVDGQTHGGIVQGVGQALSETIAWDPVNGQVLSGSFMDYGMPRADRMPSFDVTLTEDPTSGNPLRVKGGGEGGITPATAVVINALVDALAEYGIEDVQMPATPHRVWTAVNQAIKGTSARRS
ncbi:MAG: xanthine dehydrogenase family protein molybdopterin-binding subunit [Alphaproteobacteria bacterium]|nr:xanthine dehydrogenase family protein molybdopterin-binding subunit [Alphaproteobacteria bacterium]